MLTFLTGSLLVVAMIGLTCYKFVETPTIPQKKKARVPDFDVGLNLVRPCVARPCVVGHQVTTIPV